MSTPQKKKKNDTNNNDANDNDANNNDANNNANNNASNNEDIKTQKGKNINLDPGEDFALIEKAAILVALHDKTQGDFKDKFEELFESIKTMKTNEIMDLLGHGNNSEKGVSKNALKTVLKELENKHKKFFKEKKKIVKEKKEEIRKRENFVNRGLKIFRRWKPGTDEIMDKVANDYIAWLVTYQGHMENLNGERLKNINKTAAEAAEAAKKAETAKEEKEKEVQRIVNKELDKLDNFIGGGPTDPRFPYISPYDKRRLYLQVVKKHKTDYFGDDTLYGKENEWKNRRQELINFIEYLKSWVRKKSEKAVQPAQVQKNKKKGGRKKTSKIHIYLGTKPPKKKKTRKKPKRKPKKKPKRKKGGKSPHTKKKNKRKLNKKNKKTRRNKKKQK